MRNPIISKGEFIKIMDHVKRAWDFQIQFNHLLQPYAMSGNDPLDLPDCSMDVLCLLHNIFGENDADEWIEHFVFDLYFGTKYREGALKDRQGNPINLSDAGNLYDLLVNAGERQVTL